MQKQPVEHTIWQEQPVETILGQKQPVGNTLNQEQPVRTYLGRSSIRTLTSAGAAAEKYLARRRH
jgi:hypothetical protein